jgi:hypothetical protein
VERILERAGFFEIAGGPGLEILCHPLFHFVSHPTEIAEGRIFAWQLLHIVAQTSPNAST